MATIYKEGSKGEGVKTIQTALHLIPDGIFGRLTKEAVMSFQRQNGLVADGIVGPATMEKLLASFGGDVPLKKSRRLITDIVVHCTASKEGISYTADDIRRIHKTQGWSDIGYHYVVRLDGKVELGRDVDVIGAHVSGYNTHSIGVVYVGGIGANGKAKDTRTEPQKAALLKLLKSLRKIYPNARIRGHRDFSPDKNRNGIIEPFEWVKDCPCFDAKAEYGNI